MTTSVGSLAQRLGRLPKVVKFGLVGASGIAVNTAALAAASEIGPLHYLVGVIFATQISSTWNFAWTELWVFRTESPRRRLHWRYLLFVGTNNLALVLRGPMIYILTDRVGVHYLLSNLISLVTMFLLRFTVADRLIWSTRRPPAMAAVIGED